MSMDVESTRKNPMRLSQRLGITDVRSVIQGRSLDVATRNRLWSAFAQWVPSADRSGYLLDGSWMGNLYDSVWADYFKEPVDDRPAERLVRRRLRAIFEAGEWFEVYDLLEFVTNSPHNINSDLLLLEVSHVLREEMAGFRLIGERFIEITDESEIEAIESALSTTGADRFKPARHHLEAALQHLSRRGSPDYRNSIKESISAVEAVTQIISGDPRAELGKALSIIESRTPLHGALRSALCSLYGYTSDGDGIRHALTETPNLDAADAKFMLVACSAFVVYLIQKGSA